MKSHVITEAVRKSSLPAAIRRHFMGLTRTKAARGQRHGRLDSTRYPAAMAGSTAIYKRRAPERKLDTAITLLIDCSCSMIARGTAHVNTLYDAFIAAASLAEALNIKGISLEIIGFTEYARKLIHHPIKPRKARWNLRQGLQEMKKLYDVSGNNADAENLSLAYDDILQCKESNKIIIVLSDGNPAAVGHASNTITVEAATRNVIDRIQADERVKLYALGLGGFSGLNYKHKKMIDDPANVTETLLRMIEEIF